MKPNQFISFYSLEEALRITVSHKRYCFCISDYMSDRYGDNFSVISNK